MDRYSKQNDAADQQPFRCGTCGEAVSHISHNDCACIREARSKAAIDNLLQAQRDFDANPNDVGTKAWNDLSFALIRYETTGDHDHSMSGKRPRAAGQPCPGGDCLVYIARKKLLHSLERQIGNIG